MRSRLPLPAIAFDVTPLQNAHRYRGIGTYVRGLSQRLVAQTEIPIEFWGWNGAEPFETPPPHQALWLPRPPMPRYRGAWVFAQLAMRWRARRSEATIVHITDPDALTAMAGRTLMTTVYDLIPLKETASRRRVVANAGYRSYLGAVRRVKTLFAISQQTADDLVELLQIPRERILIARPGVYLPTRGEVPGEAGRRGFHLPTRGEVPGEAGRTGFHLPTGWGGPPRLAMRASGGRGRPGLPTSGEVPGEAGRRGRPYFLYLGGPNPNKNLALILDAMALATDLNEELRIAGHWLPKQVEALNLQLAATRLTSRVRHIGFVPASELADLMRDAAALVIPSLQEGFGLPVAEGLAAGAVVMHSDLPVLRETSAGSALIFAPSSAAGLAASMRQAAGDKELTDRLRKLGLERAKALTWDEAVETTLTAYRMALSK